MREFTPADYEVYTGTESFWDGEPPMIHALECGFDIVVDFYGATLFGYVGTKDVAFRLYESRLHLKRSADCAAREWIAELEPLKKHEIVALLNGVGINMISKRGN